MCGYAVGVLRYIDAPKRVRAGDSVLSGMEASIEKGNCLTMKNIPYGTFDYRDTIDICSAFINYQIGVNHNTGCSSTSNIEGDFFTDIMNPYIPTISLVTVDTANDVTNIFWNVNQSSDTYGYIILKIINGFWENIDTVYGRFNTSYTDLNALHNFKSETYAVAAFDSCLVNNIPPNYQTSAASVPLLFWYPWPRAQALSWPQVLLPPPRTLRDHC